MKGAIAIAQEMHLVSFFEYLDVSNFVNQSKTINAITAER